MKLADITTALTFYNMNVSYLARQHTGIAELSNYVNKITAENRSELTHQDRLEILKILNNSSDSKNFIGNQAIRRLKNEFSRLLNAYRKLMKLGLLNDESFGLICDIHIENKDADIDNIIHILDLLKNAHSLTRNTRNLILLNRGYFAKKYRNESLRIIQLLYDKHILNQDNFTRLLRSSSPNKHVVVKAMIILNNREILEDEIFNDLKDHNSPHYVAKVFCLLKESDLLSAENRLLITNIKCDFDLKNMHAALLKLSKNSLKEVRDILNQELFDYIITSPRPKYLAKAYHLLHVHELLTDESMLTFFNMEFPLVKAKIVCAIHKVGLLTAESKSQVMALEGNVSDFSDVITLLERRNLLNQQNVSQILENLDFLKNHHLCYKLMRIPEHRFNQELLNSIFLLCQAPDSKDQIEGSLEQYLDHYLLEDRPQQNNRYLNRNRKQANLNTAQSIHTDSVHVSVSESASRLLKAYGEGIQGTKLEKVINQVKAWLRNDRSIHAVVAKNCFKRITANNYSFTDPASNVSLLQLLALSWLALNDSKKTGNISLQDKKGVYIDILYQIQRGYNFNLEGKDMGGEDQPICTGGAFNKIVERLVGICPDAQVVFVTLDTCTLKFKIVVIEEVCNYLDSQHPPIIITGSCMDDIWPKIEDKVATRIFDEFGSLFKNKQDPAFTGLIAAGIDTNSSAIIAAQAERKKTIAMVASSDNAETKNAKTEVSPVNLEEAAKEKTDVIEENNTVNATGAKSDDTLSLSQKRAEMREHILEDINVHIKKLNDGWNPFKRQAKYKVAALEELKNCLSVNNLIEKTVDEIINEWSDSIIDSSYINEPITTAELISTHRNIFLAAKRPQVETNTQLFIKNLKLHHQDSLGVELNTCDF